MYVLAVEAIGHPLWQLHHGHRLIGEGPGIIDHKIAAVGAHVVHKEHEVPIILACMALWTSGTDCAQHQLAASLIAELART